MRRSIEEYIRRCDSCQRRKEDHEFVAPLGKPEEPAGPFVLTSMDVTSPYPQTERKNKYLLTFIDHFTKFAETFPIPDQTAETCAHVYATQIITRHGTGSKLITDHGPAFMSAFFFRETFKRFEHQVTTLSQTVRWNAFIVPCIQGCHTMLTPPIQIGTC